MTVNAKPSFLRFTKCNHGGRRERERKREKEKEKEREKVRKKLTDREWAGRRRRWKKSKKG